MAPQNNRSFRQAPGKANKKITKRFTSQSPVSITIPMFGGLRGLSSQSSYRN